MRVFSTFISMSRTKERTEAFIKHDQEGHKFGILITAKGLFGYDICGYCHFGQKEKEVVLEPFQQVFVLKVEKEGGFVKIEVVDGGKSEFLEEGMISQKFCFLRSPESDLFQEAQDHCRAAEDLKAKKRMSEGEREWEEGMKSYLEGGNKGSGIGEFECWSWSFLGGRMQARL